MIALLTLTLVAAAAPARPDLSRVDPLPVPLGKLGDVVQPVPAGGVPAEELVLRVQLEGCDRPQAIYLSRFLSGAVLAAGQVQSWLERSGPDAPRGVENKLFGKSKRLVEAVRKSRSSAAHPVRACGSLPLRDGFKLSLAQAPKRFCPAQPGEQPSDFWFALAAQAPSPRAVAAGVSVMPAPRGSADRCRPRLSIVLFDDQGAARFRYHADFGGALEAELLGDRCQSLLFKLDQRAQAFRPEWAAEGRGCGGRSKSSKQALPRP